MAQRTEEKQALRTHLRQLRRDHVAALPASIRALVLHRPPGAVAVAIPEGCVVGLYHATAHEAPTRAYAKWLSENGRQIALPWFADRHSVMRFRAWTDPYDDAGLVKGPWGTLQPADDADELTPAIAFVPLVGFTAEGERLGQGGGHYDRWLEAHPRTRAIGLAWDCQQVDSLPTEAHDRVLDAVITPTRLYGEL